MNIRQLILGGLALLLLVRLGLGTVTDQAFAQSSPSFDLGCWGVFVGGGLRQSTNYKLYDAVSQWSGGIATSPTVIIRGGFVQNWSALYAPPTVQPTPVSQVLQFYLPIVARQVRIVRTCHW